MTGVGGAVTPPKSAMHSKAPFRVQSLFGIFNNLSIQIKASVASGLLLICLLTLGANAYLTSTQSADGLHSLTNELIPKQREFTGQRRCRRHAHEDFPLRFVGQQWR